MDLPIRFPSEVEVIDKDVARFRELSAEDRVRSMRDLFSAGTFLTQISPKRAFMARIYLGRGEPRPTGGSRIRQDAMASEHEILADEVIRAVECLARRF